MGKKPESESQIDAVAMVRRIRDAQHAELEGKTWEEREAYYHKKAETLHSTIKQSRKQRAA